MYLKLQPYELLIAELYGFRKHKNTILNKTVGHLGVNIIKMNGEYMYRMNITFLNIFVDGNDLSELMYNACENINIELERGL